MSIIERLYAPLSRPPRSEAAIDGSFDNHSTTSLHRGVADSAHFWAQQLLSVERREALTAIYEFCSRLEDIVDDDLSRSLKQTLLSQWRSEVAHLYAGQPKDPVTLVLNKAIHLYNLRCEDFLAIIDGAELDARNDVRAPSLELLDHYCDHKAVAISRLEMRIFGEDSSAGDRVAGELGRALQLTDILHNLAQDAKRDRLYLPRELLHAHGIFATTPSWVLAQPALPEICRDLSLRAERHYAAAAEAISACSRRTMRPAARLLDINRAVLNKLLARGWCHLDEPVRIPVWRGLALVICHELAGR
jgi:phytoene synthase